jgi:hypothetical protein
VSYLAIDQLTNDIIFAGRVRACTVDQADVFHNDARPDFVALANDVLKGGGETALTFTRLCAAAPGLADQADLGDGTIDQSLVSDADLLSVVQGQWQVVAGLYFDPDGTPI